MSANIPISINKNIKRHLECPVCLDILKEPRILTNCGHSLCTNCIILLISKKEYNENIVIECPICLKNTEIKEDISFLKINYSLLDVINTIEDNKIIHSCPEKSYMSNISKKKFKKSVSVPDLKDLSIDKNSLSQNLDKNVHRASIVTKEYSKDEVSPRFVPESYNEYNEYKNSDIDKYSLFNTFTNIFNPCNDKRK